MNDTYVRRVLATAFALIMTLFASVCVKIMWSDGNTVLVSNVSQNVTWLLVAMVAGVASVILGVNFFSMLGTRPAPTTTTVSTQAPLIVTPKATITQQKNDEELTPT